jgi:YetA-like protein
MIRGTRRYSMNRWTRREFIRQSLATGAVVAAGGQVGLGQGTSRPATGPAPIERAAPGTARLRWLESSPRQSVGVTWGVPWPVGMYQPDQRFSLINDTGDAIPVDTWPIGYWPDGSLKWSAHAIGHVPTKAASFVLSPASAGVADSALGVLKIEDGANAIIVDTGAIRITFPKSGEHVVASIERDGKTVARAGTLLAMSQTSPDLDGAAVTNLVGRVEKAEIEHRGAMRAVVKVTGKHTAGERGWLPFALRFYLYANVDAVRVIHTFVWDGDESKDFLRGLGIRFDVPMADAPHDRHVRFNGAEDGLFGEAVRGITGLRRDPGQAVRDAQVAGVPTPPLSEWAAAVRDRLELVPAWGDYTLSQLSSDGFQIRKRTKAGHGWIPAAAGRRASGVAYVGGISGGLAMGHRDFWQRHPTQIDIRNAHTDFAQLTHWLYSPDASPMDLRFYHDGMGMDESYARQISGLDITYEDYEPGYGTAHGIARTNELTLWPVSATPTRDALADFASVVRMPPILACSPEHLLDAKVFGALWTPVDRSTPTKANIEDELAFLLDRYIAEVEQRSWYGFWDHGDVMHSYDGDRHVWRYDIGGFGWDNSELSPDLWLWYSYLRTGRADVYRFAEAMTRHTGEVDVYHAGRFRYIGTRHGVQHYSDSSKQIRISTAIYRRPFYFLSGGDERVGDLLREQLEAFETAKKIEVGRKLGENRPVQPLPPIENVAPPGGDVGIGSMGFGHLMSAWIAQAERTGEARWHAKIVEAMTTYAKVPYAFWNNSWVINLDTGTVRVTGEPSYGLSHLAAVFGLPEICVELIRTYGEKAPAFSAAYADYGRLYNATREEQQAALGTSFRNANLRDHHSRCSAWAAIIDDSVSLKQRAWTEFFGDRRDPAERLRTTPVGGPDVLNPIDEARLGTNGAAQWSLAAMQNLALIGDALKD